MKLCKVISNELIKNFVCVYNEENGIKHARVAQRTLYRAKYCQLTKAEIKYVLEKPCYTYVERVNPSCWKEVFDIHYHKNSHINGNRTEEQVIEDTNAILEECGFKLNLTVGGFMCHKKQVQRKTNKHIEKRYKKLK